jgi:hypothetical protein
MESCSLVAIGVACVIFIVAWTVIGVLPLPKSPLPLKVILYVVAAVVLCIYLLQYV